MHNNYICTHLEVGKTASIHSLYLAGLAHVYAQGGIYTKAIVPIVLSYMYNHTHVCMHACLRMLNVALKQWD